MRAKQERRRVEFARPQGAPELLPIADARTRQRTQLGRSRHPQARLGTRVCTLRSVARPCEPFVSAAQPRQRSTLDEIAPLHRLGPVLQHLGTARSLPGHPAPTKSSARKPRKLYRRRAGDARDASSTEQLLHGARPCSASGRANGVGDTIEVYCGRIALAGGRRRFTACASRSRSRPSQRQPLPRRLHRARRTAAGLDYLGGFAVTRRPRRRGLRRRVPAPGTTTTPPSWPRPSATASPRRSPS
jgi:hypothetical protein